MLKIGFMASHGGSGMKAILEAIDKGLQAKPTVLIHNNKNAMAKEVAQSYLIPTFQFSTFSHSNPKLLDEAICSTLQNHHIDLLILSGYMKKLGPVTLAGFKNRILNIHPALLPDFGGQGMYGDHVHQAVLKSGKKNSGASVHLVTAEYDQGPVLKQKIISIAINETLESLREKVKEIEGDLYVETLAEIISGQITLAAK